MIYIIYYTYSILHRVFPRAPLSLHALRGMFSLFGEKQQRKAAPTLEPVVGSAARNLSRKIYLLVARIFIDD